LKNLGDKIAFVAQPIAKGIDRVIGTNIQGCSGCKQMQDNLNAGMSVTNAIYERWFKTKQQGGKMQYQVTVIVESETLTRAAGKAETIGEVISIQARPQAIQQPARPGSPVPQRPN
jgi:hypothetical protein